nr:hypothetical protein [uncultured Sphaerochaeta sp.]
MDITIKDIILTSLSGLGVFILGLFIKRKYDQLQKQKVSKNSKGYQAGRDININDIQDMKKEKKDANTKG